MGEGDECVSDKTRTKKKKKEIFFKCLSYLPSLPKKIKNKIMIQTIGLGSENGMLVIAGVMWTALIITVIVFWIKYRNKVRKKVRKEKKKLKPNLNEKMVKLPTTNHNMSQCSNPHVYSLQDSSSYEFSYQPNRLLATSIYLTESLLLNPTQIRNPTSPINQITYELFKIDNNSNFASKWHSVIFPNDKF